MCQDCHVLQASAKNLDYFTLFNLTEKYHQLDQKLLNKTYRRLSRDVHPDFNQQDIELSQELTSYLNMAYQTLSDRGACLEYALHQQGGATAAEDKTTDKSFLINMMEFQERIENCNTEELKSQIETELLSIQSECYFNAEKKIDDLLIAEARQSLNSASYCRRLLNNLKESADE